MPQYEPYPDNGQYPQRRRTIPLPQPPETGTPGTDPYIPRVGQNTTEPPNPGEQSGLPEFPVPGAPKEKTPVGGNRYPQIPSPNGTGNPPLPGGATTPAPGQTPLPANEGPAPTGPQQPGTGQYRSYLQGFDWAKLDDKTHVTPKYQFARIAMDYAPTPEGLKALANDPRFAEAGFKVVGDDKIQLPDGSIIDVGLSFGSGGGVGWAWQPTTGAGGAALPDEGLRQYPPGYTPESQLTGTGGYGSSSGMDNQIQQMILKIMGQDPNSVTQNPVYTNALQAYDTQAQRENERMRNAIAERMDATGQTGSGAYDSALLASEQQAGENRNSFASQLAVQQLTEQRDQIMEALSLGAGYMTDQQRLALQEKLGYLNAALQQQGMNLQNSQFYAQLGQNNQQYNDTLGWQMAQWQWLQNMLPYMYQQ